MSVISIRFYCQLHSLLIFASLWLGLAVRADGLKADEPTILNISGLSLWLRADAGVVTNESGLVQQWLDRSANGNHAAQTNPVSRPLLMSDVLNGRPVLHFDGMTNFLEMPHSASLAATQDLSIFAVVRMEDYSTVRGIFGKTTSNMPAPFDFHIHQSGKLDLLRGDGGRYSMLQGRNIVPLGQFSIVAGIAQATRGTMYLNGVFDAAGPLAGTNRDLGGTARVGTRDDLNRWLKGELAELIFFRRALSDGERSAVDHYLGNKYGIEVGEDIIITVQPTMQRLEGQTATIAVTASAGSQFLRYQWQRNAKDIAGATDSSYTTPALELKDNHTVYRVRVSSAETNRLSRETTLLVAPDKEPLTISTAAFLLRDQSSASEGAVILPPYRPRFWPSGDDLSRNMMLALTQTPDGYLWLGTQGGLLRFDGEQFECMSIATERTNLSVYALHAEESGVLWVGTKHGLFQWQNSHWKKIPLPPNADEMILSLRSEGDSLWIGTRAGLYLRQNEKISLLADKTSAPSNWQRGLATEAVRCLTQNHGELLVGAGQNVSTLRAGRPMDNYPLHSFQPGFVRTVCPARDGSLWIGCNSGLIRYKDGAYSHFTKATGLPDNVVSSIYEDRRGNLWIGTFGGLCRFADGKFILETTPEGEQFDQIFCFFEDRENNLWVGAKNGLYQMRAQQFITYSTRHGLAHNNVISVYEDDEGAMWIGTWGGGLHCLRGGKISIYSATKNHAMENDLVLALAGSFSGGLWFGEDYNGGLYHLQNGEIQAGGRKEGLPRSPIRALWEQSPGCLWVGFAAKGLSVLESGKARNYGVEQGLRGKAIRCILPAHDGRIWVGTDAGLCLFTNGGFVCFTKKNGLASDSIFSLYEDPAQNLWIGTGRGLCRMKNNELKFQNAGGSTASSGPLFNRFNFFNDLVVDILEDSFENLWLATWRGVVRVNKKELENTGQNISRVNFALFDKADGMASQVCTGVAQPTACKSKDGRLWFATTKGLAVTDPKLQIPKNERPPPVIIENMLANKRRFDTPDVSVEPGRGELEFHYTALSYTAPEKNRFKYKLEGLDTDWVEAGPRHAAFYNNVPPGDYTFRVIACNNDGVWNTAGGSVKLTLLPHFWQTWWSKTFVVLAGLSAAGLAARYATRRRMQLRLERLEQQNAIEKERTRIARDLHDDLGAGLTEMLLLNDSAAQAIPSEFPARGQIEKASKTARGLVRSLDGIVWAVDAKNDSLENFVAYTYEHIDRFFSASPIRVRRDVPDELPDCHLSSEQRHNLFLVIKEALNNAAKYSGAEEIIFRLRFNHSVLVIDIEDNGKGFSDNPNPSSGNGLTNMRKRMETIGGTFKITSTPDKGICLHLELKGCDQK